MIRVFRHYVPAPMLLLVAAAAAIVSGSVYVGHLLPFVGLPVVVATWMVSAGPSAVLLTLLLLAGMDIAGLYDSRQFFGRRELFLRLAGAFGGAYVFVAVFGFLLPAWRLSRPAYLLSFVVAFPSLYFLRLAYDRLGADSGRRRKVLLLGAGRVSRLIAETVGKQPGYEVIGCINGRSDGAGAEVNGIRVLGSIDDLAWVAKTTKPDVVVAAMEERRAALPVAAILDCKLQGIEVEDWPSFYEKLTAKLLVSHLRPSWLAFSDGFRKSRLDDVLKRALDTAVSMILCLIDLPLFPVIAILIKLDSKGPVFFRQERVGKNGRIFSLLKFRTMREDAEGLSGPVWAREHDPRVTRVGRWLRSSRLDELPQLFNVLRGDMSLVGPRPERPAFVAQLQEELPFYLHRHIVKPGVTGWAQVRYRYGASVEDALEKLEYDLYYVKNRSLFLDLLILLHTAQVVLFGRGSR